MIIFPLFGYIKSFYKQSKTVFFTQFLIRAIRYNFPKTKEADIKKRLNFKFSTENFLFTRFWSQFALTCLKLLLLSTFYCLPLDKISVKLNEQVKMLKSHFRPKINFCNSNFTYKIQISYFCPMPLMPLVMYNFKQCPGSRFREKIKGFRLKSDSFPSFWAK